ncbi:MAG: hypothetical protein ABI617_03440 [Sphingomicrobium sp.]
MAKNDRDYVIKVTKTGENYATELWENNAKKDGDLDFNKNNDGLKKTEHYKLNFTIDNGNLGSADRLIFAPVDDDVMAVHTDLAHCPPDGSQMQDTFWVDKNRDGKLRLINMDLKQQKFRFKINMVRDSNSTVRPFIPLDPIVNNGNRGTAEPLYSWRIAPIVAGAIVGICAAIAVNIALVPSNAIIFGIGGAIVGAITGLVLDRR